jgi:hypothetical protein
MNFKPERRKRGRPKNTAMTLSSNLPTQNEPNNSENFNAELSELSANIEVEDWERELDGDSSKVDLELSSLNGLNHELNELSSNDTVVFVEPSSSDKSSEQAQPLISANGFAPVENKNAFKQPTTIHIIDGEKGGCGKSFLCRAFIEYCTSIGYNMAIIDADTSNQDIAKIYPNVEIAFFSDDEKLAKEADKIFDLGFEKSVIVNLPAQVYLKVTDWIKRNDLTALGHEHSITFVKWFLCTGGVDSVNFFTQSLEDLGDNITHVFVKNLGLCDDWSYIEEMPEFLAAQNKYQFFIMDFPKFPFWERNMVDRLGSTFVEAIAHPELKVVSKQRVKNFLKKTYTAFAATGLIK